MLAAESPENQKNQPYDNQDMPEELNRLQDKSNQLRHEAPEADLGSSMPDLQDIRLSGNMNGLENLIDNIQK